MKRIGLIVNPIAGLGGRVGLKGSDGAEIQQRALKFGAVPRAANRAKEALQHLLPMQADLEILAYPGEMGENSARQAGFMPLVIGEIQADRTTAEDTQRAAKDMLRNSAVFLMFTGGDGTARDICSAVGTELPALGIPAGVKIHSAVYTTHPWAAGELTKSYLRAEADLRLAEVLDIDEEAFRQGRILPKLYGYLKVPYLRRFIQGVKAPSPLSESATLKAIAEDLSEWLKPDRIYIFGPGSTTQVIAKRLGLQKTLLGVDAFLDGKNIAADASEADLLHLFSDGLEVEIIVTPIGGQGCILGRGNQQISPAVIRKVGKTHIRVVSTPEKIHALYGHPLWVDTGDLEVDAMLSGYIPIITGYKESVIYKVTA